MDTPLPLPAPAGEVAPGNLPVSKQVIATLPKAKAKVKRRASARDKNAVTKSRPVTPAESQPPKCVAKTMGHHYCLSKGCPICADLASRT